MKQLKWLVPALLFASCQKELSEEDGIIEEETCRIDRISQIDTVANQSLGYIGITVGADNRASGLTDYDSTNNTFISNYAFLRKGDTVKINTDEYYVLDPTNNNRVKTSFFKADNSILPFDPLLQYSYNAAGQVISKVHNEAGQELLKIAYNWESGDLKSARASVNIPMMGAIDAYQVEYTYYTDLPVKNFLYLHADQDALFDLAFNFGAKSTHAVKTIKVTTYDIFTGAVDETTTTTFYNYKFDSEGRVSSYVVDNDELFLFGIYSGKNQVRYLCR